MNTWSILYGGVAVMAFVHGVHQLLTGGTPIESNVDTASLVVSAVLMFIFCAGAAVGMSFVPRLTIQASFMVVSVLIFTMLTRGWVPDFLGAWVALILAWGDWRNSHGHKSKAKAAADRFLRRLLDKVRNHTPEPIPVGAS